MRVIEMGQRWEAGLGATTKAEPRRAIESTEFWQKERRTRKDRFRGYFMYIRHSNWRFLRTQDALRVSTTYIVSLQCIICSCNFAENRTWEMFSTVLLVFVPPFSPNMKAVICFVSLGVSDVLCPDCHRLYLRQQTFNLLWLLDW